MAQRQKTQAELEQEARDEEYARRLQNEFDQPLPVSRPPAAPYHPQLQSLPPVQQAPRARQVFCPVCNATNHLPGNATANQQFKCGSCSQILPPMTGAYEDGFSLSSGLGNQMRAAPQSQQIAAPPGHTMITCQNCRSMNTVPVGATTQFMCGTCYRVLSFNQIQSAPPVRPPAPAAPPAAVPLPPGGVADTPVLQGTVTRTVQVRCGQCSTVNSVKQQGSGSKLEFVCGSCRATNEVSLPS